MTFTPNLSRIAKAMGKKGGRSKSPAKLEASRKNAEKARQARAEKRKAEKP